MIDPLHFLDHVIIHAFDSFRSGHITERTWVQVVAIVNKACNDLGEDLKARYDTVCKENDNMKQAQVESVRQEQFNFYPRM